MPSQSTPKAKIAQIMTAVLRGDIALVQQLLEKRPFLKEAISEKGETLLTCAVERQNPEMVRFLLEHHINPNQTNAYGRTGLMLVFRDTQTDIFDQLVAVTDPNIQDKYGKTALMFAIHFEQFNRVKKLLEHSDTSLLNKEKQNALMWSILQRYVNEDIVRAVAEKTDLTKTLKFGKRELSVTQWTALKHQESLLPLITEVFSIQEAQILEQITTQIEPRNTREAPSLPTKQRMRL